MNRTGWLGALGDLVGVGVALRPEKHAPPSAPPHNLAQPQHGFSAANPGPAWATWDSYPTYIQTVPQPVAPYTAACGQWSAPLKKGEIDGFLYSTATMLVEYANGQPVTQQTRSGLYLFALENEMITVRKCLSQNVPIQQAKFSALRGLGALPEAEVAGWLAGMPVGLGGCGPGCDSCPFCQQATHAFGGTVGGFQDSCGHEHPCVYLPDPPAFPGGEPCGGAPIPERYLHAQPGAAFTGLGGCGGGCGDPSAFGVGAAVPPPHGPPAHVPVSPGGSVPLPGAPVSTAGGHAGPPPPWAFQHHIQPGQTPDGFIAPLVYVDVAQQMPLRPPGKMAYQPTLPWWTTWHKDEQHGFNCWWANQQFEQPVCGLGHVANFPATPDFDQLRWALRMGIPFHADPCGLAAPPEGAYGGKATEALAVLATALGVSVATVLGLKAARR